MVVCHWISATPDTASISHSRSRCRTRFGERALHVLDADFEHRRVCPHELFEVLRARRESV
jgi:hypothetical protein